MFDFHTFWMASVILKGVIFNRAVNFAPLINTFICLYCILSNLLTLKLILEDRSWSQLSKLNFNLFTQGFF